MFGFNSREANQGSVYDIQTQDHKTRGLYETRVYRDGKILAVIETPYAAGESSPILEERMRGQHEEVCARVREGLYGLVFLWISRGAIAYESGEIRKALGHFEAALAIDGTQPEANGYLEKIRGLLQTDPENQASIVRDYEEQREALVRSGRFLEAARKEAVLGMLRGRPWSRAAGQAEDQDVALPPPSRPASQGAAAWRRRSLLAVASLLLILCTGVIFTDAQLRLDPDYHVLLGREYLQRDQILLARNVLHRVLTQHPFSERAFLDFWETFRRNRDYAEATNTLEQILRSSSPPRLALFYLAEAYRLSSRFPEAAARYRKALEQGWPETACKIGLGLCFLGEDDPMAAIALWEELLERGEQDYRIDYCLGLAYRQADRLGKASTFFLRSLEKQPQDPDITRILGNCLHDMHQDGEAQKLWARAEQYAAQAGRRAKPTEQTAADAPCDPVRSPPLCFPFGLL